MSHQRARESDRDTSDALGAAPARPASSARRASPAEATLVLTTSYPRKPGDPAGHFVEAEVLTLRSRGIATRVLAAGRPARIETAHPKTARGESANGEPTSAARGSSERDRDGIVWLGGAALFGPPGALERLRARPVRAALLLPVLTRALLFLARAEERRVVAHWLLPWGLVLLGLRRRAFDDVLLVAHGSDVRVLSKAPWLARWCVERWARRGFRLRLVSTELQSELSALPGLSRSAQRWLSQATIEPAELALPEIPSVEAARARYQISHDDFIVLLVARLVPDKRVHLGLAWARAHAPHAQLWVIGEGPLRAGLEAAFPEATFFGALARGETLTRLRAAHLLLAPSAREGAPTVVREARALGTRVLAQPVGDVPAWALRDAGIELFDFDASAPRPSNLDGALPNALDGAPSPAAANCAEAPPRLYS